MTNAKEEFLKMIEGKNLKCAKVTTGQSWDEAEHCRHITLKLDYTIHDYHRFIKELDFDYDSGFGGQELFGMAWFEDNTWADRGEYDGSEWWRKHKLPEVPKELRG